MNYSILLVVLNIRTDGQSKILKFAFKEVYGYHEHFVKQKMKK